MRTSGLLYGLVAGFFVWACQGKPQNSTQTDAKATSDSAELVVADKYADKYDCMHCGMPSMDFPQWQVKAYTKEGQEGWFCSPKCMFLTVQHPKQPRYFASIQVTEYYELEKIDAHKAFYVIGGDVLGPMGHDLVPLASQEAAQEYLKDHAGKKIYRYEEVTAAVLKASLQ
ncbi:nitrous oxide reductase accessory protein NosL [Eisenibacter elegans]|uniref:nitrous oxide reductase accessory protein NosL n=1 Tax=Eisenibacter elegans TaxID=997 RepID=UPI000684943D|nr:nitrous oxide reductase accessory protein NosL [Eisenibacter elegans]